MNNFKKSIFIPTFLLVILVMFSFKNEKKDIFQIQESNTYKLDNAKLTVEDIEYLFKETKYYDGSSIFRTIKLFKTSIKNGAVSEVVTKDTTNTCDCPDDQEEETIESGLRNLLVKYNK